MAKPYYTQAYLSSKLDIAVEALACKAASLAKKWRYGSIGKIEQKQLEVCLAQLSCIKTFGILERNSTGLLIVTADGGTNVDSTILVNGVTISNAFRYTTDNSTTAALIADAINNNVSTPEYTAKSFGSNIEITATIAGVLPNGLAVTQAGGDVTVALEYLHSGQDGVTSNNMTEAELDFMFDNIAEFTGCCYMGAMNNVGALSPAQGIILVSNAGPSIQLNTLANLQLNTLQLIPVI